MSHKESEFELCEGVNVLTGPNNSGKSAVVTALQLLSELPTREGTYMIRHGEKEAVVTVVTGEGDEISWGRKEASSYLVINGERHTRISNHQEHFLNELHKVLKLPQVKNKEESFDIHFAGQKEPIFLLNDPPSRAATFFSVSSDAGRLVEVRDLFKSKINKAKEKRNLLDRKLAQLKQELERLNPLKDLEEGVLNLKLLYDKLTKESEKIVNGFQLFHIVKKLWERKERLSEKHALFTKVKPLPAFEETKNLETVIYGLKVLGSKKRKLEEKRALLEHLLLPPQEEDRTELVRVVSALSESIQTRLSKERAYQIVLELKAPPEMLDESLLEDHLKKRKALFENQEDLKVRLQKATAALQKWIQENPTCPTCGTPLEEINLT